MNRIIKAENHYLGQDDHQRMNCAQAIVASYYEGNSEERSSMLQDFALFGGGRAPENECGALYAAKQILEKKNLRDGDKLISQYVEQAGSSKCKEIRMGKQLNCKGCVNLAATFLSNTIPA